MKWINIKDFGALGDGKTINTKAIQKAIDSACLTGDTVFIPSGEYLTGSLNLKSASLYLDKNAIIKGSPDIHDYPAIGYHHNEMGEVTSLLYSMKNNNIRISGYGTIDFNGSSFYDLSTPAIPDYYKQPLTETQLKECNYVFTERVNQPIFFLNAEGLTIEGITLVDSSCWTLSFSHCKNVCVKNLTINTSRNIPNNDGMHFSACNGVVIQGCNISSGDDCIALTSITDWNTPCENFVISDCILSTCSKAILIGYMYSHVRNVTINNCVINESNRGFCISSGAGIGLVENVTVNNLVIDTKIRAGNWWGNGEPIFILGVEHDNGYLSNVQEQKPDRRTEYCVDNIIINNVICHAENAIGIVGNGMSMRSITLTNIYFNSKESANIGLKGRTLDTNPAPDFIDVPEDCFLKIVGVDGVKLINVNGDNKSGIDKIYHSDN